MALADAPEEQLVERVQALTARLEELPDLDARLVADELASAIVQLYGEGLTRIFDALDAEESAGVTRVRERLTEDGVVASLMLIHGLYPVPIDERVARALDEVRPYLDSHGGDVELLGIEDGIVHLKLIGHCRTCSASSATLEAVVEDALRAAAPDLNGMEVEGIVEQLNPIPSSPAARDRTWVSLEGADAIERGMVVTASQGLLVANVAGTLLAYRDGCAACGSALAAAGMLIGGTLTCPGCAKSFDLPRAGRCRDDSTLQLTPVPLLRGAGGIKVAVAA